MDMTDWMSAPTVAGLYWAWREGRTKDGKPSICKVNILDRDCWTATFMSGNQTYKYREGQGWYWKLADAPTPPRKAVA
jgi:hypothetical protein